MTDQAGCSGTPLAKKIGVKPGQTVRLLHAPEGRAIPDLPDGCLVADGAHDDGAKDSDGKYGGATGYAHITIAFYRSLDDLTAEAPVLVGRLADAAMLWIAWPRRAAGHVSDIGDNALRDLFLPLGVVDVKVAALGEHWSGLKFVRRRQNVATS